MFDMHSHTSFSEDASHSMLEMAKSAKNKKLEGICFTDHLDIDYPSATMSFDFNYEPYMESINNVRSELSDFNIMAGIEIGLQPHILKKCSNFLKGKNFDFVIASLHSVSGVDMYVQNFRDNVSSAKLIDFYYADLLECVKNYDDYSVFGHLDVIRRYIHKRDDDYKFEDVQERLTEIFKIIIEKGKGIEINTSGLRYNLSSSTPGPKTTKLFHELGGEIITLGSDAHRPADIGYLFKENIDILKEQGYKYACYFKELKPYYYKL